MVLKDCAFDRGHDQFSNSMMRNVLEVRLPRRKQPKANQIKKGKKSRKAPQSAQIFEMVRISCHLSHYSSNKCLILSIECINDY